MVHFHKIYIQQAISKVRAALHGYHNSRWNDLEMMTEFTHTGNYWFIFTIV